MDLILTENQFNPDPYWTKPSIDPNPLTPSFTDLFDQNGYDLCDAEKIFALRNDATISLHRVHRQALRQHWFTQQWKREGSVLNHALLFERKAFSGEALEQLHTWVKTYPVYYKLINQKAKWGLDFSIDYYDSQGNTIEVLHWEYDGFDCDEINNKKQEVEKVFVGIDWDDAGRQILKRKDEWYSLSFFEQSDWKCNYFGIGKERWKVVVWK